MKQIFIIITIFIAGTAKAQTDSIPNVADSVVKKTSTLTVGATVVNNADYYGQKSVEKIPYVAAVASYKHKSGIFINALTYKLLNNGDNTLVSAYGAGAGFNIDMKKGWSTELGYHYTWFPKYSPFLQAANPHAATVSVEHEGWLTAKLEGNYNFGKTNDVFTTFSIDKAIQLFKLGKNTQVFFSPKADLSAGTQRFYSCYLKEKSVRDSIVGIFDPVFGNDYNNSTDTLKTTTSSFDILSYNLTLPLAIQHGNYLFELSTQLSLLSTQTRSRSGQINSFFSASFYYQF